MKSLLLAIALAFTLPVHAAEPTTTQSGVKVAKKKEKKAESASKKKTESKKPTVKK